MTGMIDALGPYPLNSIVTGDARELAKAIPDESVDLIFTDPVYQNIDDYRWLAETAMRTLKDSSACLVWSGIEYIGKVICVMQNYLHYRWLLTVFQSGIGVGKFIGKIKSKQSSCLWFEKGKSNPRCFMWDISVGISNRAAYGSYHQWAKDPGAIARWVNAFSPELGVVLDLFCGGGTVPAACKTLNRNYLAFEIDPDTAELARQRVANTQPPLPNLVIEQVELL